MIVCVPTFSVQDAATFSPRTQETPDLRNCCKSCLLSIYVFFLPLKSSKSLWCAKKYVSKCYVQIVQALGYLKASNDGASQDL